MSYPTSFDPFEIPPDAPTLPDHRVSTKVKLDELRERAARICELYGPALEGPILAQKIRALPDLE